MAIRAMIVDDSAVIRQLIKHLLQSAGDIKVISTARNGVEAIDQLKEMKTPPDVILLDLEMPQMDGITALPQLREIAPNTHVIIVSVLSTKHAKITIKALSLGAADYVTKPFSGDSDDNILEQFGNELAGKIRALCGVDAPVQEKKPKEEAKMQPLRSYQAIAIAASTGGPKALFTIFSHINGRLPNLPIFITVHMPNVFTATFAEQLARNAGVPCVEAQTGMRVNPRTIYLAPGDYHMQAHSENGGVVLSLNQAPPENFCRPSADPMLRSLVPIYKEKLLTIVLTGMGKDGLEGSRVAVQAGGTVIAQNKETCVVWGMPAAVSDAGLATALLSPEQIAECISRAGQIQSVPKAG